MIENSFLNDSRTKIAYFTNTPPFSRKKTRGIATLSHGGFHTVSWLVICTTRSTSNGSQSQLSFRNGTEMGIFSRQTDQRGCVCVSTGHNHGDLWPRITQTQNGRPRFALRFLREACAGWCPSVGGLLRETTFVN